MTTATATATDRRTMTALEMSEHLEWAEVTVHFSWPGHVTAEGRVKLVHRSDTGAPGAVWIGSVCLGLDTEVDVIGDKVTVYGSRQEPRV